MCHSVYLWCRYFLIFFGLLSQLPVLGQTRFNISGTVKDAQTGETLIGATVLINDPVRVATSTNTYGFYSLMAAKGKHHITVSFTGYQAVDREISLSEDKRLNFELVLGQALNEVEVRANAKNEQVSTPQMGVEKVNMAEINQIPVLLGEKDVLKTIQLLPGIKSAGEGNSGFYVRGGSTDQNLLLLDEAPVYNASHLLGFFSTFNSDAIKDVTVYKGGMPAQFGGRLASVVDIKMDEGNRKNYLAEGGIGLISSRLKFEGPIVKDKGSFMLSARRTYADLFLGLSSDTSVSGSKLYFYDLNAKANYQLDDKNVIYLSGYFGKDVLGLRDVFGMNWGNSTATFRWNHIFSSRLFSNTSFIFSDYNYIIQIFQNDNDFRVSSGIQDFNLKQDFQYFAGNRHSIRFGLNAIDHKIVPGKISASETSSVNDKTIENRYGAELAGYVSDEWKASDQLNIIAGLRFSSFSIFGPGTFNTYNADGSVKQSTAYSSGAIAKFYFNIEPRFSLAYRLSGASSVKAGYVRNTQNMHLLSNSAATLPTDLWVMSSNNIRPEIADQVSAGYYRNFSNDQYEFSAEVYYKNMKNQIDYKNAAELRANENVESELLFGKGRAYGIELLLKKRYGNFNGWLAYTLSRSERKFNGINNGKYFRARQDRTHDLSLVAIYRINKRCTVSGTFVYNTGNAVTFPSGKYLLDGQTNFYYTERNGYRMPAYHRLDVGITLDGRQHPRYSSSWTFGLYNAYNRKNAYTIDFRDNPNDARKTEAVQTSLFGIIPSITWNFKFK